MNQKKRVVVFTAITVMLLSMATVAAAPFSYSPGSNTNQATASVFQSDLDHYMSTTDYSKVQFDKYFSYLGVNTGNWMPTIGYAGKMGSIYIGSYYSGNVLYQSISSQSDEIQVDSQDSYTNGVKTDTVTTTTTSSNPNPYNSQNAAGLLFGFGTMGIKLSFAEDLTTFKGRLNPVRVWDPVNSVWVYYGNVPDTEKDTASSNTQEITKYTDGSSTYGSMTPSLGWGMDLALGGATLKPFVNLTAQIFQDSKAATETDYTLTNGMVALTSDTNTNTAGYSNGYLAPSAQLGAEYETDKDGVQTHFGLAYKFTTDLYSNTYNDANGNATKVTGDTWWTNNVVVTDTATDKTTKTTNNANYSDESYFGHEVSLWYKYSKSLGDRLSLGLVANPVVTYSSRKSSAENKAYTSTTITTVSSYSQDPANSYTTTDVTTDPGKTTATTILDAQAYIGLGLSYSVVPDAFVLHAGLQSGLPHYTNTTTTVTRSGFKTDSSTTVNGNGYVTSSYNATVDASRSESQTISSQLNSMWATISAGFTLNVAKDIALDALFSSSNNEIDISKIALILTIKQ